MKPPKSKGHKHPVHHLHNVIVFKADVMRDKVDEPPVDKTINRNFAKD